MLVTTMTESNNRHSILINDLNHGNQSVEGLKAASQSLLVTLGTGPKWCSWCHPLQLRKPRGTHQDTKPIANLFWPLFFSQGTGVGINKNPSDPASHGYDPKTTTLKFHFRVSTSPGNNVMKNEFEEDSDFSLEDNNEYPGHQDMNLPGWDAVLWHGRLYFIVSEKQLLRGSKEAFVSLLEYAEDTLHCKHVIICVVKPKKAICQNDFLSY